MKKIVLFVFLQFACINLLNANDSVFVSIVKNVSIKDTKETIKNAELLKNDLSKQNFSQFAKSWKKVEALYFAGDMDENYIDTPRYIDVFHNLKENLNEQMQRVIDSKDEPKIALFKNSFKTINALEYVLFNDNVISKREEELAIVILNSIISKLEDIKEVYEKYANNPKKNKKWENSLLMNTMIASTYRLKEWRIAEVAGISSKYKNNPDNKRAEYNLSQNSLEAIKAILDTHKEVMTKQDFKNFYSVSNSFGIEKQMTQIKKYFKNIDSEIAKIKNDDLTKSNELYKQVVNLHNAYYFSLLEQLSITSKIVDADGD